MKTVMHVSRAVVAIVILATGALAQDHHAHGPAIPEALRQEHEQIQHELQVAVHAPGEVGSAARGLRRVLLPHFEREEQIALPPLGVLQRLVRQQDVQDLKRWLMPMADSLRAELPRMLDEHVAIAEAVGSLEQAAQMAGNQQAVQFARALASHAKAEEELFYPMAILTGEIVRGRLR